MESKNKRYEMDAIKQKFYESSQWRKVSKAFKASKGYLCEQCGNQNINNELNFERQLQVHHVKEITIEDIVNQNANILYDWNNLKLLCVICHNAERKGTVCATGYELVKGRLVKIKKKENK